MVGRWIRAIRRLDLNQQRRGEGERERRGRERERGQSKRLGLRVTILRSKGMAIYNGRV
jgi:hypothetical protein